MQSHSLIESLEDRGFEPTSYSGRGMYRARCVAVILDSPAHLALLGPELFEGLEVDQLAQGTVAYWPAVRVDDSSLQAR
jgi:hypothetical protein